VVDPELMMSVPPKLTAYQGFDALFHSTEGYVNRTANEMSDLYALKAIRLVGKSLANAVKNGSDEQARADIALANTLSGFVESTSGCISEHSIEHALSGFKPELPHGAGLIIISLEYYTFLAKSGSCDQRMVDMAIALGKKDAAKPMDFVTALQELQVACGVKDLRLSDYGIRREDIHHLAAYAREIMGGLFGVDPCEITQQDVETILLQSYR
jgi:alcohol dehydrogenase